MKYSSIPMVQSIVQHCQARGISNIIISPGSRNAPLTIGFTENPYFDCYSIVDERCAAFFAMGIAQQLRAPVVVICTSGSALLNYYPAVAEAFFSTIPVIVISADRPSYKLDIGDGQTIRQKNVFKNQIGYSANLKQDVIHATKKVEQFKPEWIAERSVAEVQQDVQTFNDKELNTAFNVADANQLPVHINVPLEEPLYDVVKEEFTISSISIGSIEHEVELSLEEFKDIWINAKRKMVLVGVHEPNVLEKGLIEKLAKDPSVLVFTETTSNLNHPNFFSSIDSIIAPIEIARNSDELFRELQPEILVTFGGLIVSKKIKAFLRNYKPVHHWHVGGYKALDTFFCLEEHIKTPVNSFFNKVYASEKITGTDYFEIWDKRKKNYIVKRDAYLKLIEFSDFLVFDILLKKIPTNYQLQLANSSTIRYTQLFHHHESLKVFCNRGTSGIDGSTSTAIGAALISEDPTLLITGDLSFFYDSNALWNNYIKNDFRIVVINNNGGGIFRILPGREDSANFENFFETKHNLNAKALCEMYGFEYIVANNQESLTENLNSFFDISERPRLLEIFTPRLKNDKILMSYFRFIS